jgi:hypothetical protein
MTKAQELRAVVAELKAFTREEAARDPRPEPRLRGRRAAGQKQLNVRLPPPLKKRLRRAAEFHEVHMCDLVERLLDQHLPEVPQDGPVLLSGDDLSEALWQWGMDKTSAPDERAWADSSIAVAFEADDLEPDLRYDTQGRPVLFLPREHAGRLAALLQGDAK